MTTPGTDADDDLTDIRPGWVGRTTPDENGLLLAVRRRDGLRREAASWPSLLGAMIGADMAADIEAYERRERADLEVDDGDVYETARAYAGGPAHERLAFRGTAEQARAYVAAREQAAQQRA